MGQQEKNIVIQRDRRVAAAYKLFKKSVVVNGYGNVSFFGCIINGNVVIRNTNNITELSDCLIVGDVYLVDGDVDVQSNIIFGELLVARSYKGRLNCRDNRTYNEKKFNNSFFGRVFLFIKKFFTKRTFKSKFKIKRKSVVNQKHVDRGLLDMILNLQGFSTAKLKYGEHN